MTFLIQYGSDETRSAGDECFPSFTGASRVFRSMVKAHPGAEAWLSQRDVFGSWLTLAYHEPMTDKPLRIKRPHGGMLFTAETEG